MSFRLAAWFVLIVFVSPVSLASDDTKSNTTDSSEGKKALRPVKVRSGAGVYHAILERLDEGSQLVVLADGKQWIKVRTKSGSEGWVSARVFTPRPKPRGYGALAGERGLSGVSTTIVTMATRGFSSPGLGGAGPLGALSAEFLESAPFQSDDYTEFSKQLPLASRCQASRDLASKFSQPIEGDSILDELERRLGMRVAKTLLSELEVVGQPDLDSYVNMVGAAVVAASSRYDLPHRFIVVKDDKAEAFALPGGFVFITTGLLKDLNDEAELAGVLGHEIAHVTLGHGAQELKVRLEKLAAGVEPEQALLKECRLIALRPRPSKAVFEADAYGAKYASCAGYDSDGLQRVLGRVGAFEARDLKQPTTKERIRDLKTLSKLVRSDAKSNSERYAKIVLDQLQ